MHRDAYDDSIAVRAYLLRHHLRFFTPLENRIVCSIIPVVRNSPHLKVRQHHNALEQTDGHVDDNDVIAIYDADPEGNAFREKAIQRLIQQHSHRINRCPACQKVTRSPLARLCPWCKHTWRDAPVA
jgi:hypothetical protein